MFELSHNSVIVIWAQQVFKFTQHILVLSWIKFHVFLTLKILNLKEKLLEVISSRNDVNINGQKCLNSLEALGELAHRSIMNWVSLELILLSENLLIPIIDILGVLLEQVVNSDVEIFMSLYSISIMENVFG